MELLTAETRKVWIPNHPVAGYLPGTVQEAGQDGMLLVVDESGDHFKVPQAEAQSVDPASLRGVEDLLQLGDFNEAALLHNIRVRYGEEKIYTAIASPILISVNPYQTIAGLYSRDRQKEYRGGGSPPVHLYSVAAGAYKAMLQEDANQSIIITGESGAGKTEATKRILAFLAESQKSKKSPADAGSGDSSRSIERQVLDANPVLEAFGNAKTVRNDNSSRFGKFIEVEFDKSGKLRSAQISNYLLEKCRIVTQQPDERNYHIFYQLCKGANCPGVPKGLELNSIDDFEYIATCDAIDGVDDQTDFREVLDCLASLGFSQAETESTLRIVAAVLHLGTLRFGTCAHTGQDGVTITNAESASLVCKLLALQEEQLHTVLEHKTLEDPLTKKTIHMPHNEQSASHTRHSMAKVIYARLFDWLVLRINESISGQSEGSRQNFRRIGLLDIYGFEVFEWNSFEQLCINFANEKLQQHFNAHMFTQEQHLYSSEGVSWTHIKWQDNQHIIDSLSKKPLGLFCLIDSECITPSATDNTLFTKILSSFKASKVVYKAGRFAGMDFAVAHYAGEVVYNTDTFLEKNTDKLHMDVVNVLKSSEDELLMMLFTDPRFGTEQQKLGQSQARPAARRRSMASQDEPARGKRQNVTVGMMFREQLDKLVEDLNKTNPRYVRCIKPNAVKSPTEFDSIDVLRQLRCAGMLESIRIRRTGYAVRRPFKEFFTRFRLLVPTLNAAGPDPDYQYLCKRLATEVEARLRGSGVELEERPWQTGHTKIFMKEELERHFERLIVEGARKHILALQKRWRGYAARKAFLEVRAATVAIQAALQTFAARQAFLQAKREFDASVLISSNLQRYVARRQFLKMRSAATRIQKHVRGWRCRSRLGKLKSKLAAEKIRRMREEEEQKAALEEARRANLERERELEAMRKQLEETQQRAAASIQPSQGQVPSLLPEVVEDRQVEGRGVPTDQLSHNQAAALEAPTADADFSIGTSSLPEGAAATAMAATRSGGVRPEAAAGGVNDRVEEAERKQKKAEEELSEVKRELEEYKEKLRVAEQVNSSLEVDLQVAHDQIAARDKEFNSLQSLNASLQKDLAEASQRVAQLENDLRAAKTGPPPAATASALASSDPKTSLGALREELLSRLGAGRMEMTAPTPNSAAAAFPLASALRRAAPTTAASTSFASNGANNLGSSDGSTNNNSNINSNTHHAHFAAVTPAESSTRAGDGQAGAPGSSNGDSLLPDDGGQRKTLLDQRSVFEKLKQQFQEASTHVTPLVVDAPAETEDARMEDLRSLESEVRRLRQENAALTTGKLSAQEDAVEKKSELEGLLARVSSLQAELEDSQIHYRGETSGLRNQLQDTLETLRQQNEDMSRMNVRAIEAEQQAAAAVEKAQQMSIEYSVLQEELEATAQGRTELESTLADTQEALQRLQKSSVSLDREHRELLDGRAADQQELAALQKDLLARRNEVQNIQRVLDDVMRAHVPVDELQKWKARAESYEQQYQQAMKINHEMTSAVGHMTQVAGERGSDLEGLQSKNLLLAQEAEKFRQELRMKDLEKQDLQKELDTLQSSCDYFQKKYKATLADLKTLQKEKGAAALDLTSTAAASPAVADRQHEVDSLQAQASSLERQLREVLQSRQLERQRIQDVRQSLTLLMTVHAEQIAGYQDAAGDIRDEHILQRMQEKRHESKAIAAKLRAMLSEAGSPQQQQQQQQQQQHQQHHSQQQQQQQPQQAAYPQHQSHQHPQHHPQHHQQQQHHRTPQQQQQQHQPQQQPYQGQLHPQHQHHPPNQYRSPQHHQQQQHFQPPAQSPQTPPVYSKHHQMQSPYPPQLPTPSPHANPSRGAGFGTPGY